jgi:hypothetical protein
MTVWTNPYLSLVRFVFLSIGFPMVSSFGGIVSNYSRLSVWLAGSMRGAGLEWKEKKVALMGGL